MDANDRRIEGSDAEAAYGGADAVEKTTYVIGMGTDPYARHLEGVSARSGPGGGLLLLAWMTALLMLVALAVYLPGIAG